MPQPLPNRKKGTAGRSRGVLIFFVFVLLIAAAMVLYPVHARSRKLKGEETRLQEHLDALKNERARLLREVGALKTSPEAIEKIARERLRFCRDGETVMIYEAPPSR